MKIKIIDVTVHVIKSKLDKPFAFSQGWVTKDQQHLLKLKQMKVSLAGVKRFARV